jgi:hypothetical protein
MNTEVQVEKNVIEQRPIPEAWKQTLRSIVEALKEGDFQLSRQISGVRPLALEDAARISRNLNSYGATIASLPDDTWTTSACQWMCGYWIALVDLYTVEEGASDLALSVRIYESSQGFEFQVESVHVP